MAKNTNLHKAKAAKNDEFYTRLSDIENEVFSYVDFDKGTNPFKDKVVLCPCDDPASSNFTLFFALNFERLGLRKLISTSYGKDGAKGRVYTLDHDITGDGIVNQEDIEFQELEGDGDFRSDEVAALREEADIIVTNPPFSLFREFIAWINPAEKQFLILGNKNAITYKEVFPLLKNNSMWLGICSPSEFDTPDGSTEGIAGLTRWFTNMNHKRRNKPMQLTPMHHLTASKMLTVQKYDNYDAIEIPKVDLIPLNYDGVMGVPITFLDRYCPDQFEIVGMANNVRWIGDMECLTLINGKPVYNRLLIRHRLHTEKMHDCPACCGEHCCRCGYKCVKYEDD